MVGKRHVDGLRQTFLDALGPAKRHDHRRSLWIIAGGDLLWCYRCGAWRINSAGRYPWHRPTGPDGENPAMKESF